MGLLKDKPLVIRRDDIRRLYEELSPQQRKYLAQQDFDLLTERLHDGEVVRHIAIDWKNQKHPKPMAITSARVFNFQGRAIFREVPLSAISELNGGRRTDREYERAPYYVQMCVGSENRWYLAETRAEIELFRERLKEAVAAG